MIIRFNELKARCQDRGQRVTLREMAAATGVNLRMLDKLAAGDYGLLNPKMLDALWTFFQQRLPDLTPAEFIVPEVVELPIQVVGRGRPRKETGDRRQETGDDG